jgi:hypothetical protein
MDVGRSFSFAFQDPEWVKKMLIGGIIILAGWLLFPLLWVVLGYQLEVTRRTYQGVELPLPEWDEFGSYFVRGLVATVGLLIWIIPLVAIIALPIIAIAVATDSAAGPVVLSLCLLIPISLLILVFVIPIVLARYAVIGSFGSMFEIGDIFTEIRRAPGALLINAVIYIVASFIGQLGFIACIIGVIFTSFYAYLIMGHMLGQVYREARGVAETPAAAF